MGNIEELRKKVYEDKLTMQEYRAWVNNSGNGIMPVPSKARWRP